MVTEKIFESALGISAPWFIAGMHFEPSDRKLNIRVDFEIGSRFAVPGAEGQHPVHDTVTKSYQHLNFFQHECVLEVRVPRVKLPDGKVVQVTAPWAASSLASPCCSRRSCCSCVGRCRSRASRGSPGCRCTG